VVGGGGEGGDDGLERGGAGHVVGGDKRRAIEVHLRPRHGAGHAALVLGVLEDVVLPRGQAHEGLGEAA